MKRLSTPAIQHLVILNMAIAILKVRKMEDVVAKAVNITTDKKVLNQKRKLYAKIQDELDNITSLSDDIFPKLSHDDLQRVAAAHSPKLIQLIPEQTTNPEILALNMLYLNFNDVPDTKMDSLLTHIQQIDFMRLILLISEEIGLQKDVAEDMYPLAEMLIDKIKR